MRSLLKAENILFHSLLKCSYLNEDEPFIVTAKLSDLREKVKGMMMHSFTCMLLANVFMFQFIHASLFRPSSHPSFVLFFFIPVLNYCPGRFMGHVGL